MLTGLAAILLAIFLCCTLLIRFAIHVLPLFVAFASASAIYRAEGSIIADLAVAAVAAIAAMAAGCIVLGLARSNLSRAVIGLVFAAPAALAGYHAVHGVATLTLTGATWQFALSLAGAAAIAAASWMQWSRTAL